MSDHALDLTDGQETTLLAALTHYALAVRNPAPTLDLLRALRFERLARSIQDVIVIQRVEQIVALAGEGEPATVVRLATATTEDTTP